MSGALTFTKAVPFRPQIAPGGGPTLADAVEHAATSFMTWRDHERAASTAAGLLDPETGWPTRKGWMAAGMAYAQGLGTSNVGAIRAFHGSPHSFDAFDLGKIGTGEGAQAFGSGMYFAGNESIARGYKQKLSTPYYSTSEGITSNGDVFERLAAAAKDAGAVHPDHYRAVARNVLEGIDASGSAAKYLKDYELPAGQFEPAYRAAADVASSLKVAPHKGHMYEANLHADPEHLLDWDKPLSQQSAHVQDALDRLPRGMRDSIADHAESRYINGPLDAPDAWTGGQFYKFASHYDVTDAPEILSETLRGAGIPGIRYLDGGSRSAGEGTHNYVMFDPANIEIIRKYGVPALIGGAAAAGLAAPAAATPDLSFTRAVPTFTKVDNAATAVGGSGAGGGTDGAAVQPVAPPAGVPAALSLPG